MPTCVRLGFAAFALTTTRFWIHTALATRQPFWCNTALIQHRSVVTLFWCTTVLVQHMRHCWRLMSHLLSGSHTPVANQHIETCPCKQGGSPDARLSHGHMLLHSLYQLLNSAPQPTSTAKPCNRFEPLFHDTLS